ncbi:MAG: pyruvate dehydrogenase (acetyl-transferring) E1 component subunit alpha, partial [Spirochaetales bacterium]|nr:pyruvate dehydrogenase (acetyl-transferring) E1 component subunit alpha [Spirochaetales bacterium]
ENNQMAIGTELKRVSKEVEIYKRAAGYGIPGVQVDGFNVFAVYEAVKKAVDRARKGNGPSLIEAKFLRLLGHFVADDQWYRDLESVEPYWNLDPVNRMKDYLLENNIATSKELESIEKDIIKEIQEAINYAANECTEPPLETLYDNIYADGEIIK